MRECVIWGCAGHAMVLAEALAANNARVVALFDNRDVASVLDGVPVFHGLHGFESWASKYRNLGEVTAFVAIGGNRGSERFQVQQTLADRGLRLGCVVHPNALVSGSAFLGEGSQVLAGAIVAAGARVGEACIINHKASLDHESVIGAGGHLAPGATVCGCVSLGRNVMVGAGAVVLPRIVVGDDVTIGAGAIVTCDVPSGVTVIGCPARPSAQSASN